MPTLYMPAASSQHRDVNMMDMLEGGFKLDERFQGVVFVGGFSYADVLDSAKG
jgi:phosphoribosylformylglycinamidine synthase